VKKKIKRGCKSACCRSVVPAEEKRVRKDRIKHIVVVSDLHVGCQLALCPPNGALQDEGGMYMPSPFQKKMWKMWSDFWEVHVPIMTEGLPYHVVINGDIVDGVHHNAVTQWSNNKASQALAALEILKPIKEKCQGNFYVIRGTEAHVGQSGNAEESIARELGAVPNGEGMFSRYELWKKLGGGLIHFTHHIGCSGAAAGEATAILKELVEFYVEAGRWNERPPDVCVRSHRHRHMEVTFATGRNGSSGQGKALSVVTPAWQGKTPFVHKIAGGRTSQPMFGGIVLSWSKNDNLIYERHRVWRLDRPREE